jgi:hypothetical protein
MKIPGLQVVYFIREWSLFMGRGGGRLNGENKDLKLF